MHTDKIYYTNLPSPLGDMIAGASDNGLCFLEWQDRGGIDRILTRVEKRYKKILLLGDNNYLKVLKAELKKYFGGKAKEFTIDLDIMGTKFEQKVWSRLLKIPYGVTKSYGNIATELNKPGASRAVGRANGSNYMSIVIPCHRVIESNGKLRGYGGGLWRKKRLLELEKSYYKVEGELDLS